MARHTSLYAHSVPAELSVARLEPNDNHRFLGRFGSASEDDATDDDRGDDAREIGQQSCR